MFYINSLENVSRLNLARAGPGKKKPLPERGRVSGQNRSLRKKDPVNIQRAYPRLKRKSRPDYSRQSCRCASRARARLALDIARRAGFEIAASSDAIAEHLAGIFGLLLQERGK